MTEELKTIQDRYADMSQYALMEWSAANKFIDQATKDIPTLLAEVARLTAIVEQAKPKTQPLPWNGPTTTCPRRMEEWGPWDKKPDLDHWDNGKCSFCGSLSPELFLERVEKGEKVVPTDKNYKAYLGNDKFYFPHFSKDQRIKFIELLNAKKVQFDAPGHFYVLPFFIVKKGVSET